MATKAKSTKVVAPIVAFTTKRIVADRRSAFVVPLALHFDDATRSMKAMCDDGHVRECRVDRLADINLGREMFKALKIAVESKQRIQFVAAGGFDPNKWFYTMNEFVNKTGADLPF